MSCRELCSVLQDLATIANAQASHQGRSTLFAKVQGPFEGHNLTPAQERVYSRIVVCAGGIGSTAVLPMLMRAVLHRGEPLEPLESDNMTTIIFFGLSKQWSSCCAAYNVGCLHPCIHMQ
jgi:hypothetical protein